MRNIFFITAGSFENYNFTRGFTPKPRCALGPSPRFPVWQILDIGLSLLLKSTFFGPWKQQKWDEYILMYTETSAGMGKGRHSPQRKRQPAAQLLLW